MTIKIRGIGQIVKCLFAAVVFVALAGCAQFQMVRNKPLTINYEYDIGSTSRGQLWDRALAYFEHEPHISLERSLYNSHEDPWVLKNRRMGLITARGYVEWPQGDRNCWSEYQITFASEKATQICLSES